MKNITLLKMTLTLLITSGLMVSSANDVSPNPCNTNLETSLFENASGDQVVKAIMVNGEAVPMIDLPVVEITAKANHDNLVRAELIDGEIVPSILLDEITITPNS